MRARALLSAVRAFLRPRRGGHSGGHLSPPDDDAISDYLGTLRRAPDDDGRARRTYPPTWPLERP